MRHKETEEVMKISSRWSCCSERFIKARGTLSGQADFWETKGVKMGLRVSMKLGTFAHRHIKE